MSYDTDSSLGVAHRDAALSGAHDALGHFHDHVLWGTTMQRKLAALGAATILAGGLTACSTDAGTEADVESDPTAALTEAVNGLGEFTGVEMTFSFDGDVEALTDDVGDAQAAELLINSSIVVRARGEDETDAQVQLVVDLDGSEALDVRFLPGSELYFRADLDTVRAVADDPSFDASIDQAVQGAEMFGAGELVQAVVDGEWVQLTGIEQMMEMAGGMSAGAGVEEPTEEEAEAMAQQLVGALETFLDEDVSVAYVGSEDAGEHVRATTDGAALQGLLEEVTTIASEAAGAAAVPPIDEDIPADAEIVIDAWIADGVLSQVGIDISAYDDEAPAGTFFLIGIADFDGDIETPDAATTFDLFGLLGGAMGGMGDMGDMGGFDDPALEDPALDDPALDDPALDDPALDDPALEDPADDAGVDGAPPADAACLPQDEVDQMLDMGAITEEELDQLQDLGALEIC